ncbi:MULTISPECIES: EscU/YscU/HrcU family type III secretion system export apparatus switch protein [Yersinia]|uniref:EscU/YscU/HrcU family type III secretion system export apparatus switch protein n=1 Tax=Yersinia TaxID=629 RepID=UPI001C60CAEB|nr:EscU/YscU/HrcU family type III secretion system export apparatus switch protein [Yersinia kristensenii]MBW5812554.1 EscU/YscU/HrcU family type III secretion system export apparatus switch protein [Yersinia kristensenii]MBW5817932.1 EscU/YscU/HrcU family type III secretion system export apparatus switch protein [Yersinia kristensenii]MBW5829855.1 EscU/YscU/HrcU family type III secretion system export apparatus switch protein [Yersinia kristensenii]MBW5842248.1 EscU/YscU/HrcU family type III s
MESSEPKKYPPTAKKMRDLRKKGQFPKTDLAEPTFSIALFYIVISYFILLVFSDFNYWFEFAYRASLLTIFEQILSSFIVFSACFIITKFVFFIIHLGIINRFVLNQKGLGFKFDKLNPITGFKNALGLNAISSSFRKVLELLFLILLLKYVFDTYSIELNKLHKVSNPSFFVYDLLYYIGASSLLMAVYGICVGVIDYLFEHYKFLKKNRMTMTEMKNEMKDTEGSPLIKMERRSRMRELVNESMTTGRRPTFAIANPTHILVPICFEQNIDHVPIVLSIYTNDMALDMRCYFESLGIPIIEDIKLARKISHKMKNGRSVIPKEFYRDVALIIVTLNRKKSFAKS